MTPIDLNGELTGFSLLPAAAYATSTDGTGVDIRTYKGQIKVMLNAGAATAGTNPTCSVKIQESAASGSGYTDITGAVFTTVTTAASVQTLAIDTRATKRYIRAVATIGGTDNPSFPVCCHAVAQAQSL